MCCRPTFVMNFCILLTRLSLRLRSGNTCLYLVQLSTKKRQYRAPPMALDGPKPMSTCQMSLNLVGRATFFSNRLWLCMVAICPGCIFGLVSPWKWILSSLTSVGRSLINFSASRYLMDWRRLSLVMFSRFGSAEFGRSSIKTRGVFWRLVGIRLQFTG